VETGGKEHTLGPCEAVVVATGYRCNPIPAPSFGKGAKVQIVGDAIQPRSIYEAIQEGFDAAVNIGS
jgi:hypothetical protein